MINPNDPFALLTLSPGSSIGGFLGAQADRDFEIVFTSVEGDRFQGCINGLDQMTFNPPESAEGFAPPPTVAFDVTLNRAR